MCGLVANFSRLSNGFTKKGEEAFYDMLYADALRGEDSTGIIGVQNDGSFGIAKVAEPSPSAIPFLQQVDHLKDMFTRGKALIGHNRKATIGKIKDENAHPFVVDGKFAMVHNGTLYSHKHLADVEIDSEALTIHLSKYLTKDFDLKEFEDAMGEVFGAYAIIAYNMETETVYFTRNDQRPLFIIEHDEGFALSSEVGLAVWCLSRNGFDTKVIKPTQVKPHVLYSVDLDTLRITEQEYSPKKAMPVTPATTTSMVNTTVVKTSNYGTVSKNLLKRLKRKWIGRYVSFFVDDWVEKNFPKTIDDGETELMMFGEADDLHFTHTIQAVFDTKGQLEDASRIVERCFRGQVVDIERSSHSNVLTVYLHDVSMFKDVPAINTGYLTRKLEEETSEDLKQLCVTPHETKTNLH